MGWILQPIALRPCPKCGAKASPFGGPVEPYIAYTTAGILCDHCGHSVDEAMDPDSSESIGSALAAAIKLWNEAED